MDTIKASMFWDQKSIVYVDFLQMGRNSKYWVLDTVNKVQKVSYKKYRIVK